MAPILHCLDASPPVRSVYMTAAAIGLELEKKTCDLFAGGHMSPEYLKLNPQHTVPTLEDGDFSIWDSHVIGTYLIGTYAKNDSLYPKDLKKRAVIDQRLHFDSGVLFPRLAAITVPIWTNVLKSVPKDKAEAVNEAYTLLETLLTRTKFLASDEMTLADLMVVTTVTSLDILVPIAENKFPTLCKWIETMKKLPYYNTANKTGLEDLRLKLKEKME